MMRPKKPRFFKVVVVIGAGVGTGVAEGVAVAVAWKMVSCARMPPAAKSKV